jgi:predicted kinase
MTRYLLIALGAALLAALMHLALWVVEWCQWRWRARQVQRDVLEAMERAMRTEETFRGPQ